MNDQNEQLGKETWPTINYSFVLSQLKADIVQFQTEMIKDLFLQNFCMPCKLQLNSQYIEFIANL